MNELELIKCHLELINIKLDAIKEILNGNPTISKKSQTTIEYIDSIESFLVDIKDSQSVAAGVALKDRQLFLNEQADLLREIFRSEQIEEGEE